MTQTSPNHSKDLLRRLKKDKEKMLALIGVTNWKVDKTDLYDNKGITSIRLAGSYIDSFQKKVHFVEYHYYSSSKRLQILLTNSTKSRLEKDSKLANIKAFRNEYGI